MSNLIEELKKLGGDWNLKTNNDSEYIELRFLTSCFTIPDFLNIAELMKKINPEYFISKSEFTEHPSWGGSFFIQMKKLEASAIEEATP